MIEHLSYNRICAKWQDTKQGTKYWVCLSKAQAAVEERGKKMERERERKRGRGREGEREGEGREEREGEGEGGRERGWEERKERQGGKGTRRDVP